MNGKIEQLESKEQLTSKIVLEFFRHGEKENKEGVANESLMLTSEGRNQATKKGKELHPQPDVSIVVGSPRRRTQETATRIMLAEKEEITPEMSLDEIEEIINSEQKYGKKIIADSRLDFSLEGPIYKKVKEAVNAKNLLNYTIYESDRDALDLKDKITFTYSRSAGNIAELIKKYINIAPKFDRIVRQNPEKYTQYKNQMERYMGTHQTLPESLLAKALEKIKGEKERDAFIASVGGEGLGETQGIRVEINNTSQGVKVEIKYKIADKEESLELPPEILDEIIKDRDEFNRKIEES